MRTVMIKGMSCQHCVQAVVKALSEIAGVSGVRVDLKKGEATFEELQPVDLEAVHERIRKAGFEVG